MSSKYKNIEYISISSLYTIEQNHSDEDISVIEHSIYVRLLTLWKAVINTLVRPKSEPSISFSKADMKSLLKV